MTRKLEDHDDGRMTVWSELGELIPSQYTEGAKDVDYEDWCFLEVERLLRKGVRAEVRYLDERNEFDRIVKKCAIFRTGNEQDTADDRRNLLAAVRS